MYGSGGVVMDVVDDDDSAIELCFWKRCHREERQDRSIAGMRNNRQNSRKSPDVIRNRTNRETRRRPRVRLRDYPQNGEYERLLKIRGALE